MKEFNLKDYERWCEEHKMDVSDEKSLTEYKLSLNEENAPQEPKNDELESFINNNFEQFIKSTMILLAKKENANNMSRLADLLIEFMKRLENAEEDVSVYEALIEATQFAFGNQLDRLIVSTYEALKLFAKMFDNFNSDDLEKELEKLEKSVK